MCCWLGIVQKKREEGNNIQVNLHPFRVSRLKLSIHSLWLYSHTASKFHMGVCLYIKELKNRYISI